MENKSSVAFAEQFDRQGQSCSTFKFNGQDRRMTNPGCRFMIRLHCEIEEGNETGDSSKLGVNPNDA